MYARLNKCWLLGVILLSSLSAQVLNVESFRKNMKSDGEMFQFRLGGNYSSGENELYKLNTGFDFFMKREQSIWMWVNQYNGEFANDSDLVNKGYSHIRLNREINNKLQWEYFVQAQFNSVELLESRYLAGTGPRLALLKKEKGSVFFGPLYMFELETLNTTNEASAVHRLSAYLSAGVDLNETTTWNAIGYYQPGLSDFSDYRLVGNTSFGIKLNRHTAFNITAAINFDSQPPEGITQQEWSLTPAITYQYKSLKE